MADEQKPEGSPTPSNPPAASGAHAAPKPPAAMATTPWENELTQALKERFAEEITEFSSYLGQNFLVSEPDAAVPILEFLKLEQDFDYLVDITAVDYPQRQDRFDLVRIKTRIPDGFKPAATGVHLAASWLEREVPARHRSGTSRSGLEGLRFPECKRSGSGFAGLRRSTDVSILQSRNEPEIES
jgi:hypothetical protein